MPNKPKTAKEWLDEILRRRSLEDSDMITTLERSIPEILAQGALEEQRRIITSINKRVSYRTFGRDVVMKAIAESSTISSEPPHD